MPPRRFCVTWKDSGDVYVTVDDGARSLYKDENDWEIAASLACVGTDYLKVRSNIKDVREV